MKVEVLFEELRDGVPGAWESFVEEMGPRIYRYFCSMLKSQDDPENLTGQSLQLIHQSLDGFQHQSSLESWVFGICRNVLRERLRQAGRWQFFLEHYTPFSLQMQLSPPTPEELLSVHNDIEQMREALRGLPLKYKEVLVLRYIQELSIHEAAESLGLTPALVKNRTQQAKKLLAKRMGEKKGLFDETRGLGLL